MSAFFGFLFALIGVFIIFTSMCWAYTICKNEDDSAWAQFYVSLFFCGIGIANVVVSTLYFVDFFK